MVIYENYDCSLNQLSEYYLINVIDIRDFITQPLFYKNVLNISIPCCLVKYSKLNNSDDFVKSNITVLTDEIKAALTKMNYVIC